jgi:hypothetical protein
VQVIEREIEEADGIYPLNGGRLSIAEVCRRAGVSRATLEGPIHKKTTRVEVKNWLGILNSKRTMGAKRVRSLLTDRALRLKERCKRLEDQTHLYHLHMVTLEKKLEDAHAKVLCLEEEILRLQTTLSEGKVVQIR